ncbi:hypothetical protein H8R23_05080 [Flavobacterium sp. F-380]|uniref:ASCH domain-containing protein n=1 Tax=Flavobacterium kayseriense TaxID=2764714 RepID=A0ABR7J5Q5_9FLAO|nr:hypothetical protein [Flavobacterium kayseriense]MBC5840771.1 hypothetical protein [Flavobacterium kayseriense]MBC5846559.1 hypothetical protein [Flavobacterium kayseriense]
MSKTKYHPILFSTPMVQAIIEGRKTQTRRTKGLEKVNTDWRPWKFVDFCSNPESENDNRKHAIFRCFIDTWFTVPCLYEVGDVLWVRETFCKIPDLSFSYKASICENSEDIRQDYLKQGQKWANWKPSIFMPKEACRIFLKVKSIRIERLQDISEEDAQAEGAKDSLKHSELKILEGLGDWPIPRPFQSHQFGFLSIWCTINGCENWLENPFVWVYEFEKIEKPLDFIV